MSTSSSLINLFEADRNMFRMMTPKEEKAYYDAAVLSEERADIFTPVELIQYFKQTGAPDVCSRMGNRLAFVSGMEFSLPVVLFLCSLCNYPSQVSMWAYSLVNMSHKRNDSKVVTFSQMSRYLDRMVPKEECYFAAWDAQKVRDSFKIKTSRNYLDTAAPFWKERLVAA
jgi:hypothetical protein